MSLNELDASLRQYVHRHRLQKGTGVCSPRKR
jgi:hypothetical protein